MLKKQQLGEKLKKLQKEGVPLEKAKPKDSPIKKRRKTRAKSRTHEKPIEETLKEKEPILRVKKAERIEETKPDEFIEELFQKKRDLKFINDLSIPAQKLAKHFKIETSYTEDSLHQNFTAWKDPDKIIKWTVKKDEHGKEFYSLRNEGLIKMKDNPPIFGMEFEDGALISTHMGDYTFIMGSYNFDVKTLVKIFAFGIDNAKRFNL
jgi:hypothetical protein